MKKILLFILAVIVLIFAYSEYKEYQRFHPKNANIEISKTIDLEYHNQESVSNYYNALEVANNFMQMQWSTNQIDVRSPVKDNEETAFAVSEYGKKVANVNYYKTILERSKTLKTKGLTNEDIKFFESKGVSITDYNKAESKLKQKQLLLKMMPEKDLRSNQNSPFIYEIQKLLIKKGYKIPLDGVYKNITSDALKSFEEKNNLYPDGKIDVITLEALMD
jgi:hypothetical protein